MIAVRTQFRRSGVAGRDLSVLRRAIERAVPLSMGAANRELSATATARIVELEDLAERDYAEVAPRWRLQLGTLGSGNHFNRGDGRRERRGVAVPAQRFPGDR